MRARVSIPQPQARHRRLLACGLDELAGPIVGSAVGAAVSLTPGVAPTGSAAFNSGAALLAGTSAGTSSSDVPAGGFARLLGDPLAGNSGIAGIRSGLGPSNGSAVRGGVLGFWDRVPRPAVTGIEDAVDC